MKTQLLTLSFTFLLGLTSQAWACPCDGTFDINIEGQEGSLTWSDQGATITHGILPGERLRQALRSQIQWDVPGKAGKPSLQNATCSVSSHSQNAVVSFTLVYGSGFRRKVIASVLRNGTVIGNYKNLQGQLASIEWGSPRHGGHNQNHYGHGFPGNSNQQYPGNQNPGYPGPGSVQQPLPPIVQAPHSTGLCKQSFALEFNGARANVEIYPDSGYPGATGVLTASNQEHILRGSCSMMSETSATIDLFSTDFRYRVYGTILQRNGGDILYTGNIQIYNQNRSIEGTYPVQASPFRIPNLCAQKYYTTSGGNELTFDLRQKTLSFGSQMADRRLTGSCTPTADGKSATAHYTISWNSFSTYDVAAQLDGQINYDTQTGEATLVMSIMRGTYTDLWNGEFQGKALTPYVR